MMREVWAENQLSIDGNCAGVAQLVEQHICNVQVAGSSPITSSNVDGSSTGRAPVCGTGCCEFKPRPSTQTACISIW